MIPDPAQPRGDYELLTALWLDRKARLAALQRRVLDENAEVVALMAEVHDLEDRRREAAEDARAFRRLERRG